MTIRRNYECNLCRERSEPKHLIGLWWESWPQAGWIQKPATETENHLCSRCVACIRSIAEVLTIRIIPKEEPFDEQERKPC